MRLLPLITCAALGLASCGGGSSETIIAVQVVDFEGSSLGAVPVTAEQRSIGGAGQAVNVTDPIETQTDGKGVAYLSVEPAKDYRVEVELALPSDPGCSYVGGSWVSSANPEVTITLDRKVCT